MFTKSNGIIFIGVIAFMLFNIGCDKINYDPAGGGNINIGDAAECIYWIDYKVPWYDGL